MQIDDEVHPLFMWDRWRALYGVRNIKDFVARQLRIEKGTGVIVGQLARPATDGRAGGDDRPGPLPFG